MSADASKLAALAATRSMFGAARRRGFALKNVAEDTGFAVSTLTSWASEIHEMPLSAFRRMIATRALPLELLSLLLPDGVALVGHAPDDALAGLDALALGTARFTATKLDAEADGRLDHREIAALREDARELAGQALRVAEG